MTDLPIEEDNLIGKNIVDVTGKNIGKCVEVVEGEDAHLIIEILTKSNGKKKTKIPMETIQGIGELIILNVEIEGLVEGEEILDLNGVKIEDDSTENDIQSDSENKNENIEKDEVSQENDETTWVLYKSIKT